MKKSTSIFCLALALCGCKESTPEAEKPSLNPYISKVFEYVPAPGQFVNALPQYVDGYSAEEMLSQVESAIAGQGPGKSVTLGGFGGYIVFGFEQSIENRKDLCDLRVYGNAYTNSGEPGIIMVSRDENGNGLPDDKWYEIKGSAHDDDATIDSYTITYKKIVDSRNIEWSDNQGSSGIIEPTTYHTQSYFPEWIDQSELTFTGTRLPDIARNTATGDEAPYWQFSSFDWGYADNLSNKDDGSAIDIDWAIDDQGTAAELAEIDFIKVYSAEHQIAGWLGEVSTEVSGAADLHLLNIEISSAQVTE